MKIINNFRKEYFFLSNFYPCIIDYNGIIYPSSEHAYQASKTLNIDDKKHIVTLKTKDAKEYGQKVETFDGFSRTKEMKNILTIKFNDPILKRKLLLTGDIVLIEGNTWHDNFWGSCVCCKCGGNGMNNLGKILMVIRDMYKNQIK